MVCASDKRKEIESSPSSGLCVHCVVQIDMKGIEEKEGRKEEWGVQNGGEWKLWAFHPIRVASGETE